MKKISLAAIASLLALTSISSAQSFDVNSMPLGNIPTHLDATPTGSVQAKNVFMRKVKRDGASLVQYYTIAKDGSIKVLSDNQN